MIKIFQIKKLLKYTYVFLLVFLSFYFFLTGYNNYNNSDYIKYSKNSIEDILTNQNEKNMNILGNNKKEKIMELPYKVPEFALRFKQHTWNYKKDNLLENKNTYSNTKVASLMEKMIGGSYDLDQVSFTKKIPGFFVSELPKDISYIEDAQTRKKVFISIVLPLIVEVNRDIELKRNRLQNLREKLLISNTLNLNEHNWLINLAVEYSVNTKHVHKINIANELLKHIDIIPNSVAIAQAAKESGWGTSRFAKEGNALFGQWTYDNQKGLLPSERTDGERHFIKSFVNLRQSVISYMKNINSHQAYKSFRERRAEFRSSNMPINPIILVHELSPYAELPNYTNILELIINKNKLFIFDNIKLVDQNSLV